LDEGFSEEGEVEEDPDEGEVEEEPVDGVEEGSREGGVVVEEEGLSVRDDPEPPDPATGVRSRFGEGETAVGEEVPLSRLVSTEGRSFTGDRSSPVIFLVPSAVASPERRVSAPISRLPVTPSAVLLDRVRSYRLGCTGSAVLVRSVRAVRETVFEGRKESKGSFPSPVRTRLDCRSSRPSEDRDTFSLAEKRLVTSRWSLTFVDRRRYAAEGSRSSSVVKGRCRVVTMALSFRIFATCSGE